MSKTTSTTRRITITIPDYLEERLKKQVPAGQVSSFVSEAIEEKIDSIVLQMHQSPLERWFEAADKLPKFSREEIQAAIDQGRP